jgi:hypothetical protein
MKRPRHGDETFVITTLDGMSILHLDLSLPIHSPPRVQSNCMRRDRDPEQFIKENPYLRKFVVECAVCHRRGLLPGTAAADSERGPIYRDLQKLFPLIQLDKNLICDQCP